MSAQQLKIGFIELLKPILSWQSARKNNNIDDFSCTMFCPSGQNEPHKKKCDAQIPCFIWNLRSPNEVRGNNRLTAVIEDTLIITLYSRSIYEIILIIDLLDHTFY